MTPGVAMRLQDDGNDRVHRSSRTSSPQCKQSLYTFHRFERDERHFGGFVVQRCRDAVAKFVVKRLSDVEALVLDPLAAVAVGVLEAKVVVVAQLLGKNIVCEVC
jgi:hypothetical protein